MTFTMQRFALGDDMSESWTVEEISTNRWTAHWNGGSFDADLTISGVSNLENNGYNGLIATLAGELKDVTYTLDSDRDFALKIGDETYTMKAGVTNGKFVEDEADDTGEVVSTSVINSTRRPDGTIVNKTISFINPEASDSDIAASIAALNGLSKNTKKDIVRVDRKTIG